MVLKQTFVAVSEMGCPEHRFWVFCLWPGKYLA